MHRRRWSLRRGESLAYRRPARPCWTRLRGSRRSGTRHRRPARPSGAVPAPATAPRRMRPRRQGRRASGVRLDRPAVQRRSAPGMSSFRHDRPADRDFAQAVMSAIVARNRVRREKPTSRTTVVQRSMILHRTRPNGNAGIRRSPALRASRDDPHRGGSSAAAHEWRRVRHRRYPSPAPGSVHRERVPARCTISSSSSSHTSV